jgi:hypothetical protein
VTRMTPGEQRRKAPNGDARIISTERPIEVL